jgi:GNAT superfamily N-acetyltransferase
VTAHVQLTLVDELGLDRGQAEDIRRLLAACFPDWDYPRHRRYFKQLPARRLLAREDGRLLGQLGLEHRAIGTAAGPATILGTIDLCVAPDARGRGVAGRLLDRVEQLGSAGGVEFLVLFATDRRLYERHGYRRADNPLRWLRIDEHASLGIGEEAVDELMVKPLTTRPWPEGPVDLLGYLF